MRTITYTPIGVIRSPFRELQGMPIQPAGARGTPGELVVREEFADGLSDLAGFSHITILYHFHLSKGFSLTVKPFLDETPRGLFSTRAPRRPNAIGLSTVRLTGVEGNVVRIEDVDVVDGTPLLDIKPHVPRFDHAAVVRIGWLEENVSRAGDRRSDERFIK